MLEKYIQLSLRFAALSIALFAASLTGTGDGWCAASASASGNGNTARAILSDIGPALPSEERATELAARFFDPLLAEARTDTVRATLLHQRGVLYLRSNFKLKAITDFNNALQLLPEKHEERFDLFFHRACAYLLLPEPDALSAIRDINICLAATPNDAEALIIRATAYRKLGKKELAAADIDRAALLAPKSDTAVQELLKNAQGANQL